MDVLLTNDDGIQSQGIRSLYSAFKEAGYNVSVVAPVSQQSAMSHRLTFYLPLRITKIENDNFSGIGVYGTPTDCVKLALGGLLPRKPDLVVSGINAGPNVGPDIMYSGTIAAASEAALENIPCLAISHCDHKQTVNLLEHAKYSIEISKKIDWGKLHEKCCISINYPEGTLDKAKGVKVCKQTLAIRRNFYEKRNDPWGLPYWWFDGEVIKEDVQDDSDKALLDNGFITVTPLRFEFTDMRNFNLLEEMLEK